MHVTRHGETAVIKRNLLPHGAQFLVEENHIHALQQMTVCKDDMYVRECVSGARVGAVRRCVGGVREGLVGKKPEEWDGISQAAVSKENSRQRRNPCKALRWIILAV